MLKLMKYEFRKQLFSKIILFVLLILMEIGFWVGILTDNEALLAATVTLFLFLAIASVLFVSYESIFTYSNDLKTKHSYMLFMTPNSTYKIIGAKVLTTMVTIIITAIVFLTVAFLNISILLLQNQEVANVIDLIKDIVNASFNANLGIPYLAFFCASMVFSLIGILTTGMASITLSATFLSNSKGKGVVSVVFFFVITFVLSKIEGLLLPDRSLSSISPFIFECFWSLGVVVIFYFLTSYMLDKKVSV